MSSLIYLLRTTIKNRIWELRKKPALLILYLVCILGFVLVVVANMLSDRTSMAKQDIDILEAIIMGYFLLFVVSGVVKGLDKGGSFFGMSDVNFLFSSPISSKKILVYGILKQAGMALLGGLFIFFQLHTLRSIFGIEFGGVLVIFLGFALNALLAEMLAVWIYSISFGRQLVKTLIRMALVACFVPAAGYYVYLTLNGTADYSEAFFVVMESPVTSLIPVSGWLSQGIVSFVSGDLQGALLFFCICTACLIAVTVAIAVGKADYYEDVLVATETVFARKMEIQQGNINAAMTTTRKIKIKGVGVGGSGASAFFFKHLRESVRGNRFVFLDMLAVLTIIAGTALAYFVSNIGVEFILYFSMYLLLFFVGTGNGLKELYSHYIYMVPSRSETKMFWSNLELVFKFFIESVILFSMIGFIRSENAFVILLCILVRTAFILLTVAINVLSLRIFTKTMNVGVLLMLYILIVVAIMLPGIVLSVITAIVTEGIMSRIMPLTVMAAWELLAAAVCFYFSRGILHKCDMATQNQK